MVCQAAGQTRFRAFKHEIGISGTAAVIVKTIACYQPFLDCQAEYFRQLLKPSINPSDPMLRYPAASKALPILDPSTHSMFEPDFILSPGQSPASHKLFNSNVELPLSKEATTEEMHEDSDEIDALLYSDSDEEASTGHSPLETVTGGSEEEVASTGHSEAAPAKRRRIGGWYDSSVADTASSTGAYYAPICEDGLEDEAERKKAKRERIQETVGVLRRIIPGGKGKDAATVIDEAISYLKSLKLHARAMESGSML